MVGALRAADPIPIPIPIPMPIIIASTAKAVEWRKATERPPRGDVQTSRCRSAWMGSAAGLPATQCVLGAPMRARCARYRA